MVLSRRSNRQQFAALLVCGVLVLASAGPHACPLAGSSSAGESAAAAPCPGGHQAPGTPDSGSTPDASWCAMACGALAIAHPAPPSLGFSEPTSLAGVPVQARARLFVRALDHIPLV